MGITEDHVLDISRWMESKLALIPPSYMAPPDTQAMELRYMKKSEKSKVKLERKLKFAERRKKLLDPTAGSKKPVEGDGGRGRDVVDRVKGGKGEEVGQMDVQEFRGLGKGLWQSEKVNREGLQEMLHGHLDKFRAARKGGDRGRMKKKVGKEKKVVGSGNVGNEGSSGGGVGEVEEVTKGKLGKGKKKGKKRKIGEAVAQEGDVVGKKGKKAGKRSNGSAEDGEGDGVGGKVGSALDGVGAMVSGISDTNVKGGGKRKKGGKRIKQELLKEAESKVEKRKQFTSSGEGGEDVMRDAWSAALDRAKGEKVADNPKLLRKNMKQEEKKKRKSVKQWKERVETVQAKMAKKRDRAKANLRARADKKMERRKMKRLKKLLN